MSPYSDLRRPTFRHQPTTVMPGGPRRQTWTRSAHEATPPPLSKQDLQLGVAVLNNTVPKATYIHILPPVAHRDATPAPTVEACSEERAGSLAPVATSAMATVDEAPLHLPGPARCRGLGLWAAVSIVVVVVAGYGFWSVRQSNNQEQRNPVESVPGQEVTEQVRAVRVHLERDEVSAARTTLDRIPIMARQDPAAVAAQADVIGREARRDNALRAARECIQSTDWTCAVGHARIAQSIDRTSGEAREVLEKITNLGLMPSVRPNDVPAGRRLGPGPVAKVKPAPTGDSSAAVPLGECEAIVAVGRRALANSNYDQAIASANDVLSALGLCGGAQQLKQDAIRARDAARRSSTTQ